MTPRAPFDPQGELLRWGPIPGRFGYVSMFVEVHYKHFQRQYPGENWSETLFLFKDKRMFWINDLEAVRQAGLSVFLRYLLPQSSREKIYHEWQLSVSDLRMWIAQVQTINLAATTNDELQLIWNNLHKIYQSFWTTGSIPELANYGSEDYLKARLREYTEEKAEVLSIMEILTAPTQLSFYQEEEIDLARTDDLADHTRKYFWLKNSYAGTTVLTEDFFQERQQTLPKNLEELVGKKIKATTASKKNIQKKYHLNNEIREIAEAISAGIAWQDERKKYVFQVIHYQDQILSEVARRFDYNTDDLHNTWYQEISEIISGKNLHNILNRRESGFGLLFYKNCLELEPEDTAYFWQLYSHDNTKANIKFFSGITASKGAGKKVSGRVRIVLDPTKSEPLGEGEILVAPMTSPEYIFAMKHASAIITDTGGLTSHAAIVSRELGIPCVVGTKVATHVLKDGELVEVDPETATVARLSP